MKPPFLCALLALPFLLLPSSDAIARDRQVVGTKKGKVYHTREEKCNAAKKILTENKVRFPSTEAAERAGRRLCRSCERIDQKTADAEREAQERRAEPDRPIARDDEGREKSEGTEPSNQAHPAAERPEFARVSKVLVGGTLVFDNGEKAVLLGTILPLRGQARAKDALRFLTEHTRGRTMRLAHDDSACGAPRRDRLGRLRLHVTPDPDGRDLAGELIFQGFGWVDRDAKFRRRAEYLRREEEAWRAGHGIWQKLESPAGDGKVVTGRHASEYHRPKCIHARHLSDVMDMSLNEAKSRRLVPCSEFRRPKAKR